MSRPLVPGPAAGAGPRKSELSSAQQQLIELMSKVHFGRVLGLHIRSGQPILVPSPRVIRTLKIAGRNDPRPESPSDDFVLKAPVVELLDHLKRIGEGVVERIEIAHGMPLLIEVREQVVSEYPPHGDGSDR